MFVLNFPAFSKMRKIDQSGITCQLMPMYKRLLYVFERFSAISSRERGQRCDWLNFIDEKQRANQGLANRGHRQPLLNSPSTREDLQNFRIRKYLSNLWLFTHGKVPKLFLKPLSNFWTIYLGIFSFSLWITLQFRRLCSKKSKSWT